eukprot:8889196-Ditylum_brightwellii.AAC.1
MVPAPIWTMTATTHAMINTIPAGTTTTTTKETIVLVGIVTATAEVTTILVEITIAIAMTTIATKEDREVIVATIDKEAIAIVLIMATRTNMASHTTWRRSMVALASALRSTAASIAAATLQVAAAFQTTAAIVLNPL